MSKNSAVHQKKVVQHAVLKLLKHPGLSIPDTMVLAKFSKKDVANKTVHRAVHQAVRQRQDQALLGMRAPSTDSIVISDDPSVLDMTPLTGKTATESSALSAPHFPKPKRKQI